MTEWQRRLRTDIIRSSRVRWIRTLYRKGCQLATWMVGRRLASLPGVEAVYTRHSHPRFITFAPGQSDIDLTVILNDDAAQNAALVRACTDRVDALSLTIPFVFPQDARFVSRRELAQMEAWPGAAEILSAPAGWVRIGGREVRRGGQIPAIEHNCIATHPEFNAGWLNVMQTHVMSPGTDLDEGNLRLPLRVAMKSQQHFQIARGRLAPSTQAYLSDSEAASLFADDAAMADLIRGLAQRGFWARSAEESKARIFHRTLVQSAEFYRDLAHASGASSTAPAVSRSPSLSEAHRCELHERINREGALRAIAESIVVYPTPHWTPREYQIDLLLRDDVSSAAIADAVRTIKRSFGGRTFGIGGTHAQITLIPRSAFEHPWFFLGAPFPFLHEHVAAFAEVLFGAAPRIPAPPSRTERQRWCARYFFFHRYTLHYRPTYISKDCNFCQLAAMRLFLEHGAILTDAAQVRHAYQDAYVRSQEEGEALDFLMRRDNCAHQIPFAAALELQSREYAVVETLLRRNGAL